MERIDKMPVRNPINGTFELTVRCNLHCKMCLFRPGDEKINEIRKKELTAQQWISLGRQAADAGTLHLLITGGEPMIRPDFCDIWRHLYRMGFVLQLYTNATMVTPEIMDLLNECPPHQIGVTIYGSSPEVYEKVCRDGMAFEKMVAGIKKLQTLPSIIDYRTTIIQDNYEDVDNIEKLVRDTFHSEQILSQTQMVMKSVRGGCADAESCRLTPEQNVKLYFRRSMQKIRDMIGEELFNEKCVTYRVDPKKNKKDRYTLFGCNAGMNDYTISYDGKLLGCQILGQFSTDALQDGLQKAWIDFPYVVKRKPDMDNKCSECKNNDLCWSCAASRYAETGDYQNISDYICQTTQEYSRYIQR